MERFSVGDGSLWEDAWFYAASNFLMTTFLFLVATSGISCNISFIPVFFLSFDYRGGEATVYCFLLSL